MRIFTVFILLLIMVVDSNAQQLNIVSCEYKQGRNDINNRPKDLNGEICALVVIEANDKIVGCSNMIGEVVSTGNSHSVYITPQANKIRIDFETLFPVTISFQEYGITQLKKEGYYRVVLDNATTGYSGKETKKEVVHEYVDLGLSVKWATTNIGAQNPNNFGDYYSWGETETKDYFLDDNCLTYKKKIGNNGGNPEFDVARYLWGDHWRLPTKEECEELCEKCEWKPVRQKSKIQGYLITGKNGNSIFLPTAGSHDGVMAVYEENTCAYWTSSQMENNNNCAYFLYNNGHPAISFLPRYCGLSIRAVYE